MLKVGYGALWGSLVMLRGAKGVYWGAKKCHGVLNRAAGRLWGAAGVTGVLGGGSVW